MTIWTSEIKELEKLYESSKGQHSKLDKELEKLIKTDDENIVLVYARRCLEVIITDLSQRELKRPRGTEPLKGIIDKLNKEEKVPNNIIVSMQNLNSLSTFGAHPKDFDPRQVKPVILDLTTVLEWYLTYMETQETIEEEPGEVQVKSKGQVSFRKTRTKSWKRIITVAGILIAGAVIIVSLIVFDIIGGGKQARAGSIESLVILPFGNYTGVDTLEYFVSGMHSSLITEIGKLSGLRTIGKTSSEVYKNASKSVQQIASELDVDAVIETDIMCLGDTICLQARLISAGPEEKQLWIGEYKEERGKILNLYNRVIKQISGEVKVSLTPKEEELFSESRRVVPEAYDAYLKGMFHYERLGKVDIEKAIKYLEMAIEIDPEWAPSYAGLARVWFGLWYFGYAPKNIALPKAYEYLTRSLELDPNSANAQHLKAKIAVYVEWDWEKGEREFLKSLELDPNDAQCRLYYAHLLMTLRRTDEAITQAKLGVELDPLNPLVLSLCGVVLSDAGDYSSAIAHFEKALSIDPNSGFAKSNLESAYLVAGDYERWFEVWKEIVCWDDEVITQVEKALNEQGFEAAIEKLFALNEKYGKRGCQMGDANKMIWYLQLNDFDKALDYLEKLYEISWPGISYISTNNYKYNQLKAYPRYIEILKKMNLPLP